MKNGDLFKTAWSYVQVYVIWSMLPFLCIYIEYCGVREDAAEAVGNTALLMKGRTLPKWVGLLNGRNCGQATNITGDLI